MSAFINPFTDFGFKKLFGEESALPRLKSFIEDALELAKPIADLHFMSAEQLGSSDDERRAVYDIYCTADDGSHLLWNFNAQNSIFSKIEQSFMHHSPFVRRRRKVIGITSWSRSTVLVFLISHSQIPIPCAGIISCS